MPSENQADHAKARVDIVIMSRSDSSRLDTSVDCPVPSKFGAWTYLKYAEVWFVEDVQRMMAQLRSEELMALPNDGGVCGFHLAIQHRHRAEASSERQMRIIWDYDELLSAAEAGQLGERETIRSLRALLAAKKDATTAAEEI